MILQDKVDNVERIGGGESHKFSIKVNRKSFQILSDLYSDKPLAVVRELGCNAYDSHVSAGKADLPISIHLPNSLEPHLEIRDFGTGISPDDIKSIYSAYFESTKTKSNDAIGCLGLGSKSPFCYSDNFTVTVRHNGMRRLYLAYFDESGAPTITLASEDADNESNGVSIQIPVKKEDCDKFRQAAIRAFKWFPVKPEITGAKIDWKELDRDIVLSGKGWRVLAKETTDRWSSQPSYAIMGGVNYMIDEHKVNSDVRAILNNLVVEFPIGQLDFTPSRESLSYDDRTVANLNARLAVVKSEIAAKAMAEMSSVTYLNEAAKIWQAMPDFVRRAIGKFTWKGATIESVKGSVREITKRSYRKNLCVSNREYTHLSELAKLKGISFTLEKKTTLWKVKEFLQDNASTISSVLVFDDEAKRNLLAAGVDPSCFVCSSTLTYAKTGNTMQRQIDKEVVGIVDSSYQRFDSINLRKAITNGAKYYAVKQERLGLIKGKTFDKDTIRRKILSGKGECSLCVFVAPTKEKLALSAGLTHVDNFIDAKLALLQSADGQRYLALKAVVKGLRYDNDNTKKYIKIAANGKSGLAKHLTAGVELSTLEKKFIDVALLAAVVGVSAKQAAISALPTLTALEQHLLDRMNEYYGCNEAVYAEFEAMASKI